MSSNPQTSLELIVYGASGRMGKQVIQLAESDLVFTTIHKVRHFDEFENGGSVIIDFSLPQALGPLIKYCRETKTPVVSGTTGLSEGQFSELKELSKEVPVLWSANMSLGVMVVTRMLREMSALKEWSFKISETHHVHKKDSPSGTALKLKEALEKAVGEILPEPESIREGEVIGDHSILAIGPFEQITLNHHATDRRLFAQGALSAAKWLVSQKPGFYSLQDIVITA